jgi:hypothetical protein
MIASHWKKGFAFSPPCVRSALNSGFHICLAGVISPWILHPVIAGDS